MKIKSFIFRGPAGTGKTSLAEKLAGDMGADVFLYQCNSWTTQEELVQQVNIGAVAAKLPNVYLDGPILKAAKNSLTRKTFLVIDELDKSKEMVDALFLDFLQNGRVMDIEGNVHYCNPSNLVVVFTTNEVRELADPLLRRAAKYHIDYLPQDVEAALLLGGEYYMDPKREWIQKTVNAGKITVKANAPLQALVMKIAGKLREAGLDISLSELQSFYKALMLVEAKSEIKFAIEAWLVRNEDYADVLSLAFQSKKNLVGNIWALLK